MNRDEWRSIATAPKDQRIFLYFPGNSQWCQFVCGEWNQDEYAKRPRPYWTHDREWFIGVRAARKSQPTHWMPLPHPPPNEEIIDET